MDFFLHNDEIRDWTPSYNSKSWMMPEGILSKEFMLHKGVEFRSSSLSFIDTDTCLILGMTSATAHLPLSSSSFFFREERVGLYRQKVCSEKGFERQRIIFNFFFPLITFRDDDYHSMIKDKKEKGTIDRK